jgi:hypothetical protein
MTIKQIQCLLAYLGYYAGEIDGKWGPLSEMATVAFQFVYGLEDDGVPGKLTQKALKGAVAYGMPTRGEETVPEQKDFWNEIEYFDRNEFACKCGGKYCDGFPVEPDRELLQILVETRKHFGQPVYINSGIRCETHNKNVGGASRSQHMQGTAADIRVKGEQPKTVAAYLETLLPNTGGIGIYDNFVHVDVRKNQSRWRG